MSRSTFFLSSPLLSPQLCSDPMRGIVATRDGTILFEYKYLFFLILADTEYGYTY